MIVRHQVMESLVLVVGEHDAARRSVAFLLDRATSDPSLLRAGDPSRADLRLCLRNLERTYLVRLFALFEETLRDIWLSFGKNSQPKTKDLLDGCASRRKIPTSAPELLTDAHAVREFRNFIVHGTPAPVVSLADAKSRLCKFLAHMPESWPSS